MTPQHLRLAFTNWKAVHEAVHGPLSLSEAEIAYEVANFLITCAQAEESVYPAGAPYNNEYPLPAEDALNA